MRRTVAIVLSLLVVVIGLEVAPRLVAQAAVARKIQQSEGLSRRPDVQVGGFPFLTQMLQGRYQRVDVQVQDVPVGNDLRLDEVDAQLVGVQVPVSALLGTGPGQILVDEVRATGLITFSGLNAAVAVALPSDQVTVLLADGGGGLLRVSGTYRGLGGPLSLTANAHVSVSHGLLVVTVPQQELGDVPAVARPTVARLLTLTVPLQRLPWGLTGEAASVGPGGVVVSAQASDVVLRT